MNKRTDHIIYNNEKERYRKRRRTKTIRGNIFPFHVHPSSPLFHLIETIKMLCFYEAPAVCASMDKEVVSNQNVSIKNICLDAVCACFNINRHFSLSLSLYVCVCVLCVVLYLFLSLIIRWFDQHTKIAIKSIILIHVSLVECLLTRVWVSECDGFFRFVATLVQQLHKYIIKNAQTETESELSIKTIELI